MCGHKDLFSDLNESVQSVITFGDQTKIPAKGKGRITIKLNDGSSNSISDVYYVPGLRHNLLSLGQLSEKGYDIQIVNGVCTIHAANHGLIAKVKMTPNRLFPLYLSYRELPCFSSMMDDDNWLWHMRFGHLNFNMIHSDLCSVETTSHGGGKYFITFIDDFSRKTWVYILKNKSDACYTFKKFMAYVEKQSGEKIKVLRTDRGQEYIVCDEFLEKNGIKHQLTARYTPQQNGVAERKNRTIMDMVRCMLKLKNLPKYFWAEAVACAVYILNRSPSRSVNGRTPYEVWSGRKPNIQHLRVFGCIAYSHVPDHIRKKLDEKAEKCIFIGYSTVTKGYKLYNPKTEKVIISRDVTFDEQGTWDWSLNEDKPATYFPTTDNYHFGDEEQVNEPEIQPPMAQSPAAQEPQEVEPRRSTREHRLPSRFQDYQMGAGNVASDEEIVNFALYADCDPLSFEEACEHEHWIQAMGEEIHAIEK
ncbi:unnamed protein product, partial [Prunus brigantina]